MKRSLKRWGQTLVAIIAMLGVFQFATVFGASDGIDFFSQCSNDDGDGYTGADVGCHWINGNLNASNSTYHEGDATVQRLAIDNLTTGDHTVIIKYGTTKGGKHAYDYLTNDNFSELNPNPLTASDLCDPSLTNLANCASLTAVDSDLIPTDPNAAGHDTATANRHFRIRNGTWVAGGILSGPTVVSGSYAADSETAITIKFHVDSTTCSGAHANKCEVLITWGAHISSQADWGAGNSAVSIPGSPYHVQIADVDGSSITGGGRDNQMQASAIIVTPTVATELHKADHTVVAVGSSVPLGTTMHDKVIVTGSTPTGNVTLRFFNNGTCTGDPVATSGNIALSGGSVDATSFPQGPLAVGSYGFLAHYNGDTHNTVADGTCENFTVGKADTTTVTQVHNTSHSDVTNTSVPLGSVVHDSATVNGQVGSFVPTGTVTYNFYTSANCSEQAVGSEVVAIGTESSLSAALAAGSYGYKANYSGDTNYNASNGVCEPFTVSQAQLTVATNVHDNLHANVTNSSVPLGSVVHDTATLTGGVGGFATPAVDFAFYNNSTCDGSGTSVTNTGADEDVVTAVRSAVSSALGAGQYSYKGSVVGNANYLGDDSDCEPFTVNQASTSVSTAIHTSSDHVTDVQGTSLALNSAIHDKATVNGQIGAIVPTGSLNYNFYHNGACAGDPFATDSALAFGSESSTYSNLVAGNYSFLASYNGDTNYSGSTGTCETVSVDKANTTTVTEIHKDGGHVATTSVALGDAVHDKAIVGTQIGSIPITGTVSYVFYTSGDCTTGGGSPMVVAVGGETPSSGSLAAGSYSYQATYSGDDNYNGSVGDCEPLTVNKANPAVVTELHNSDETVIGTEASTSSVHDKATVTGGVSGFVPSGNVEFTFYTNGTCSSTGAAAGTVALTGTDPGVAHPSSTQGPLAAGSYSFKAHYVGDANYLANDSDCEPFTVTTLTINKLANGGNDTFGYTVTGTTNATPSVTTTGTPGTGATTIVVLAGQYTVGETTIPSGWQLVGLSCAGGATELGPTSSQFNVPAGQNVVCNFENSKQGKTRTQGFWSTHTVFANLVWDTLVPAGEKDMSTWGTGCTGIIDASATTGNNELMGGFWSNIANTTTGKRSALDKTRMQMLQQLLAAMLNKWGLNTSDSGLIDQAQAAYCGTNQNAIQQKIGQLGTFNESGDSVPLGFSVPNATPKASKDQANIVFWNNTTTHP